MEDNYDQILRLNILEMMNSSKTYLNIKRYSDADLMIQLDNLYQFAKKKPSLGDLSKALVFLLKRDMVDTVMEGKVDMFYITDNGRDILQRIADGDDTVIY